MAWIELHQSLWTHRKTLMLAAAIDLPPMYAATHMIHFWCWAVDNAPDGDLSNLPNRVIAAGAGWTGDVDVFVDAAVRAGFLDRDESGLRIHDWDEYAGRLIERRAAERERSRQRRAAARTTIAKPSADQPTPNGRPADVRATAVGTVPNRTVPECTDDDAVPASKISTDKKVLVVGGPRRKRGAADPNVKLFIDYYHDRFLSLFGEKPFINGGKDGEMVRRLLGTYGFEKLKGLLDAFFESRDPYIMRTGGYTIGVFATQVNKLIQQQKTRDLALPDAAEF